MNKPRLTVGASVLGLVTRGIADNPLVMYREYIQNSVDALAASAQNTGGRVEVLIDWRARRVRVRDNGPGLSYEGCVENLLPVGRSKKTVGVDRGFRGIGRLSGLAFASSITFLTRSNRCDPVTRVVWSGSILFDAATAIAATDEAIPNCVSVDTVSGANYPDRFFEVQVDGVSRHAAGEVLNQEAVRTYISEVCPVPIEPSFPFARDVEALFAPGCAPHFQEIFMGDDPTPIRRQYGPHVQLAEERVDRFSELEPIRVPSGDGPGDAAIGWVAHSSYLGAIPKRYGIRGVKARVGNIQIGGERVFDHLFPEERFNRWCVGELHILDRQIVPNARRDYFEPNAHLRHLENQLGPVFRQIAMRCRSASSLRNRRVKVAAELSELEAMCYLTTSGYLAPTDAEALVQNARARLGVVSETLCSVGAVDGQWDQIIRIKDSLKGINVDRQNLSLAALDPEELAVCQSVFGAVIDESTSPAVAMRIIQATLARVMRSQT